MNVSLQKTAVALWSKPDPVLVGAGAAGELFIAKLRLGLAAVLLLIPILNTILFRMQGAEAFVGIGLTVGAVLISAGAYAIAARVQAPWWLSFATSFFDVTLVTVGLGTIEVTHNGQTYHVCCTGCRDYFNENPEKVLAEYKAKKK